MLLGLELVDDELLQGGGLCSGLCVALLYFLEGGGCQHWRVYPTGTRGKVAARTVMFPFMSFLTREKVVGPRRSGRRGVSFRVRGSLDWRVRGGVPKMGVRDSAASMNSLVAMALFLSASTGTSTKERLKVLASKNVPPGGITGADMAAVVVVLTTLVGRMDDRERRQGQEREASL